MKHIFTLAVTALMGLTALASDVKEVPYVSALCGDSDWTLIDNNNDGKTWADDTSASDFSGSGFTSGIKYSYHGSNPGDDWYISPAIHLEAGKEYKLKIWHKNGGFDEAFKIYMSTGSDITSLSGGTELFDFYGKSITKQEAIVFTPAETADYYFGIYCCSPRDKYYLYVTGFQILENVFAPGAVTNLKVAEGADRALTATLTWALPTVDIDGAEMPEDASFDEVLVYRDGAQIASLEGTATEFVDDESHGLTSGKHTYEVQVVVNGAKSAKVSVDSKYIGPVAAQELPYIMDASTLSVEDFELYWSSTPGRNTTSTKVWEFYKSYNSYFKFQPTYRGNDDIWLISPEMKFTKPGVYRLTFNMQYAKDQDINFDIILGKGTSVGGYPDDNIIGNIKKLPTYYEDFEVVFEVTEPGEYGIAFHITIETASSNYIQMTQFKVEEWSVKPAQVANLATTVNDDATVTLTWTNPTLNNIGKELTSLDKAELYCDDELVETFDNVTPGQEMTATHTPATPGVHTYYVLTYLNGEAPQGDPVKVKTGWVGDETQTLPYSTSFAEYDPSVPIWSSVDGNDDGYTWIIGTSAKMNNPKEMTKMNDYLLSPYFDLAAGYYTITLRMKGENYQKMEIGTVTDKKNVVETYTALKQFQLTGSYDITYKVVVHIENAGKQAITIHNFDTWFATGNPDEVTSFYIEYTPVLPGRATDLEVIPASDLSLSATVSWKNPTTTNIEGVAATDLVKAVVKRNNVEIATITEGVVPGDEMSYEDNDVPNAGEYTYTVEIWGPEGQATQGGVSIKSPWIGAGMNLPFSCEDSFIGAGWNIYNLNNDSSWGYPVTWEANSNSIYITSDKTTTDDWAITPRLNFDAGNVYKIELTHYKTNGYDDVDWDLWFGKGVTPDDKVVKIATVHTDITSSDRRSETYYIDAIDPNAVETLAADDEGGNPTYDEFVTKVPAGVGTIGMHANGKGAITVTQFKVSYNAPTGIEDVKVGEGNIFTLGSLVSFSGIADQVVVVDMTGKVVLTAEGVDSISLEGLAHGVYVVSATVGDTKVTAKVTR